LQDKSSLTRVQYELLSSRIFRTSKTFWSLKIKARTEKNN